MGLSGTSCGDLMGLLGGSWVFLEALGGVLGASWRGLGISWEPLGHLFGALGSLLGCSWGALADSSGALEVIFENLYGEEGALGCENVKIIKIRQVV